MYTSRMLFSACLPQRTRYLGRIRVSLGVSPSVHKVFFRFDEIWHVGLVIAWSICDARLYAI